MDIDIPITPVDEPIFDINIGLIADLVKRARQSASESTCPRLQLKPYLNALFSAARDLLHHQLSTKNSASWILEAYKQLQMWTFVFRSDMGGKQSFTAPPEFAPAARYGWRYAIGHLLQNVKIDNLECGRPSIKDVIDCFTTLLVMATTSEWSNLVHYFPDVYGKGKVNFNNPLQSLIPELPKEAQAELENRHEYLMNINWRTWKKYPGINVGFEDPIIKNLINQGLLEEMGFSLEELNTALDVLSKEILSSGFVIVHSLDYILEWVVDYSGIDREKVNCIFNFLLLSGDMSDTPRDFLNRADPLKTSNFAGVKLPAISNLDAIYAPGAVAGGLIRNATAHIILSLPMLAEWQDILQYRLVHGQRIDLKERKLKQALEAVEQYQRRTIFENAVSLIFQNHGFKCIVGLKKWPTEKGSFISIPCGEIDIVAYHEAANILVVAECKAGAGATDARGYSQQYRDHFQQKKYHNKFIAKYEWLQRQDFSILSLFDSTIKIKVTPKVLPLFVTKFPSVAKFYVKEYRILTFEELDSDLENLIS